MTNHIQCRQDYGETFLFMVAGIEISRIALEKYLAIIFKIYTHSVIPLLEI